MTQPKTASKSSSHTPGPWYVEQVRAGHWWAVNQHGTQVADAGIAPANARLIAAAPEMYKLTDKVADAPYHRQDEPTVDFAARLLVWWVNNTLNDEARRIKAAIDGEG